MTSGLMPFGFGVPSLATDDPASLWKTPLVDPNASGGATDPSSVTLPPLSVTAPQPQAGAGAGAGASAPMTDQQALIASAQRLGLSPVEWGGIIHYESGADPSKWGGTGGRHVGLIQFGPQEQKDFGVTGRESFQDQLGKAEAFLASRGYKPGMGVMNAYSTINAGSPGRFNASDAGNGGMPGTVADKVNSQFAPHYAWANKFLGGGMQLPQSAGGPARAAGFGLSGPTPGAGMGVGSTMSVPGGSTASSSDDGLDPMKLMQAALGQNGQGGQGGQQSAGGAGAGGGGGGGKPYQVQAPKPRPFGLMRFNMFGGQP